MENFLKKSLYAAIRTSHLLFVMTFIKLGKGIKFPVHPDYIRVDKTDKNYDSQGIAGRPLNEWMEKVIGEKHDVEYFESVANAVVFQHKYPEDSASLTKHTDVHISNSQEFCDEALRRCVLESYKNNFEGIEKNPQYSPFLWKTAHSMVSLYDNVTEDRYETREVFYSLGDQIENLQSIGLPQEDALAWTKMVLEAYRGSEAHTEDFIGEQPNLDKNKPDFYPLLGVFGARPQEETIQFVGAIREIFGEEGLHALKENILEEQVWGINEDLQSVNAMGKAMDEEASRYKNEVPEGVKVVSYPFSLLPKGYFQRTDPKKPNTPPTFHR